MDIPIRRSARAVRPWHPWRGHSLVQGCRGRREGVFRVPVGVSGIGVSASPGWAGGQQRGDRVAAHLDASMPAVIPYARASGPGTALWPAGTGGSVEARAVSRDQVVPGAPLASQVLLVAGEPWLSYVSLPRRIPTSPGLRGRSPQNPHGRNGIPRHTAARVLKWA